MLTVFVKWRRDPYHVTRWLYNPYSLFFALYHATRLLNYLPRFRPATGRDRDFEIYMRMRRLALHLAGNGVQPLNGTAGEACTFIGIGSFRHSFPRLSRIDSRCTTTSWRFSRGSDVCRLSSFGGAWFGGNTPRPWYTPLFCQYPLTFSSRCPTHVPYAYIVYEHSQDVYRFRVSYASHHHFGSWVSSCLLHRCCISLPRPPHTFRFCPLSTKTLELLSWTRCCRGTHSPFQQCHQVRMFVGIIAGGWGHFGARFTVGGSVGVGVHVFTTGALLHNWFLRSHPPIRLPSFLNRRLRNTHTCVYICIYMYVYMIYTYIYIYKYTYVYVHTYVYI